ncbi:hypothetical protein PA7_11240 [Pseudonocardia asaccharolytica DSM 44247 = NBRC 16224]|uniref:Uncharacterized protein n=1 Tax=Pseudonocardia asaccharolytica DSM 44247 = NBRC 16224 TaxID=1123024 RepID=A0A511CXU6_9PSEU|nr:hypothetical protein PA7_11240 [Pseudonocardia asaccharolytica DSM 44247 = NBRC 16224]
MLRVEPEVSARARGEQLLGAASARSSHCDRCAFASDAFTGSATAAGSAWSGLTKAIGMHLRG